MRYEEWTSSDGRVRVRRPRGPQWTISEEVSSGPAAATRVLCTRREPPAFRLGARCVLARVAGGGGIDPRSWLAPDGSDPNVEVLDRALRENAPLASRTGWEARVDSLERPTGERRRRVERIATADGVVLTAWAEGSPEEMEALHETVSGWLDGVRFPTLDEGIDDTVTTTERSPGTSEGGLAEHSARRGRPFRDLIRQFIGSEPSEAGEGAPQRSGHGRLLERIRRLSVDLFALDLGAPGERRPLVEVLGGRSGLLALIMAAEQELGVRIRAKHWAETDTPRWTDCTLESLAQVIRAARVDR